MFATALLMMLAVPEAVPHSYGRHSYKVTLQFEGKSGLFYDYATGPTHNTVRVLMEQKYGEKNVVQVSQTCRH